MFWLICKVIAASIGLAVFGALVAWPLWRDDPDTIEACRGEHDKRKG